LRTDDPVRCADDAERVIALLVADVAGLFPKLLRLRGLGFVADLALGSEVPFDRDEVESGFCAIPAVGDHCDSVLQVVRAGPAFLGSELNDRDDARALPRRFRIIADKTPPGD